MFGNFDGDGAFLVAFNKNVVEKLQIEQAVAGGFHIIEQNTVTYIEVKLAANDPFFRTIVADDLDVLNNEVLADSVLSLFNVLCERSGKEQQYEQADEASAPLQLYEDVERGLLASFLFGDKFEPFLKLILDADLLAGLNGFDGLQHANEEAVCQVGADFE